MLPSASLLNGFDAPHAGRAVEVEEDAGARAAAVLQHEVAVQQDGLDLGEERVMAVDVCPTRLHHADAGLGKVVDDPHDPVGGRGEVGVEDGHELALGTLQAVFQCAGLEAAAVGAVDVDDVMAFGAITLHHLGCHLYGLIGRIVQ